VTRFLSLQKFRTRLAKHGRLRSAAIFGLTYRVYDYGRTNSSGKPRELHLEKRLPSPTSRRHCRKSSARRFATQRGTRALLAACPYFATERAEYAGLCDCSTNKARFELLVVLKRQWTNSVDRRRSQLRSGPVLVHSRQPRRFRHPALARIFHPSARTSPTSPLQKALARGRCFARCAFPHSFRLKLFLRAIGPLATFIRSAPSVSSVLNSSLLHACRETSYSRRHPRRRPRHALLPRSRTRTPSSYQHHRQTNHAGATLRACVPSSRPIASGA